MMAEDPDESRKSASRSKSIINVGPPELLPLSNRVYFEGVSK